MNPDLHKPTCWRPAPLHPREKERLAALRSLQLIGKAPQAAYARLSGLARTFLQVQVALIALVDEEFDYFISCSGANLSGIPKDDGPCGYTILRQDPLVIPDMLADPTFAECPIVDNLGVRFYAGMPLMDESGLPIGTLCMLDGKPRDPDAAWVASLTQFAAVAQDELALTRSNLRINAAYAEISEMNRTLEEKVDARTRDLHDAQVEMLARLGLAAEARDDDTGAHVARVAAVSGILARTMGMTEAECEMVRQATPMHDIGKIGVPDAILLKPGQLADEEYLTMREHAIQGSRMLGGGKTALLRMAETIARTHHERWDGTGYPWGLAGEAIPLVGRIVAVADVFDALTAERPYKRAWNVDEAVSEIVRGTGSHFDPKVVDAFLATLPEILGAMGLCALACAA